MANLYHYKKRVPLTLVNLTPLVIYITPHPLSLFPLKGEREEIDRETSPL
jgi:hypothetical protein